MSRKLQDVFFKKAKAEGYLARSAYKLLELQKQHRIIPSDGNVLDLGCSPGAWLQVAAESTSGQIVGIDLKECTIPPGLDKQRVRVLRADAGKLKKADLFPFCQGFHAVLSDLCHATIGNSAADAARSLQLGTTAAMLALGTSFPELDKPCDGESAGDTDYGTGVLLTGGNMIIKLLEGPGIRDFTAQMKPCFARVRQKRPQATRQESREVYLLGLGRNRHER